MTHSVLNYFMPAPMGRSYAREFSYCSGMPCHTRCADEQNRAQTALQKLLFPRVNPPGASNLDGNAPSSEEVARLETTRIVRLRASSRRPRANRFELVDHLRPLPGSRQQRALFMSLEVGSRFLRPAFQTQ